MYTLRLAVVHDNSCLISGGFELVITTPLKLVVVGCRPSAPYVASRILKLLSGIQNLHVLLFDRLWAPHRLVRYVAPDHQGVRASKIA